MRWLWSLGKKAAYSRLTFALLIGWRKRIYTPEHRQAQRNALGKPTTELGYDHDEPGQR